MMQRIWIIVGVCMIGMLAVCPFYRQTAVQFANLHEAASSFRKLNYTCCSDVSNGQIISGFMVSKEAATCAQANELCKSGPVRPNWKNKVWVMRLPTGVMTVIPDDAGIRVWGRIFAFGDSAFLDEIENKLLKDPPHTP